MDNASQPSNADLLAAVQGLSATLAEHRGILTNLHEVVGAHGHLLTRVADDQSIMRAHIADLRSEVSSSALNTRVLGHEQKAMRGDITALRDDLAGARAETRDGWSAAKVDLAAAEAHLGRIHESVKKHWTDPGRHPKPSAAP